MSNGIKPTDIGHKIGCPGRYGVGEIDCDCPGARRIVHVYPIDGDATEMLQNAINKAGERGTVYLHPGEYRTTAPLWKRVVYGFKRLFE